MSADLCQPAELWLVGPQARSLWVRPIVRDDAAALAAFVAALSPRARRQRFHTGLAELSPAWLRHLTQPDPATDVALAAIAWQHGALQLVAEARYAIDRFADPAQREFALAVADDWQGQGLGRRLLRELARHAAERGVRQLAGDVQRDNLPMLQLAQSEGFAPRSHPDDARLLRLVRAVQAVAQPARPDPTVARAPIGACPLRVPAALALS